MDTDIIPQSYEDWHHCITVICQQELTKAYIEARINALSSSNDYATQKFVQLYGEQQRIKTLQWFKHAQKTI